MHAVLTPWWRSPAPPSVRSVLGTLRAGLGTAALRRLSGCFLLGELATWMWFVVLAVYAYAEGGAPAVGLAALSRMLPAGLVAPAAGSLVDRFSRRDVVVAAVAAQSLAAVAAAGAVRAEAPLAAVYAVAALSTVATALYRAADAALALEVTTNPAQLAAVNVVESLASNAAFLVGALAGGTVMAVATPVVAFGVVGALHLAALVPALGLPRSPVPAHRDVRGEAPGHGLRQVLAHPDLARLLGFLTVTTLVEGAVDVLVVVVALDLLDIGDAGVGWLNAGWGLGGVVGALVCLRLLVAGRLGGGLLIGGVLIGGSQLLVAARPSTVAACALLALLGVGYALIEVSGRSLLQRLSADDVVGRAFGLLEAGRWMSTAAGAALAPALVALVGTRAALVATGAVVPLATLLVWRSLARWERSTAVPEEAYAALRSVTALAPLPPVLLEDLAVHAKVRDLPAGEAVVRRGDGGTDIFVVSDGTLDVTGCPAPVPPLRPGDFFGELAVVHGAGRTATVVARVPSRVVVLDGPAFLAATGTHTYARRATEALADVRWSNSERPVP